LSKLESESKEAVAQSEVERRQLKENIESLQKEIGKCNEDYGKLSEVRAAKIKH